LSARPSFFAELQRRHVYKVGAMYCVAGWLLVQVVTQVLPVFDVSALGQRVLVLIVVAGFPVALVLAWLFDLTPQGIVRTAEAPAAGESPAALNQRQGTERKLNYVLGALLLLGIVYTALDHTVLRREGASVADRAAGRSIAVLPFDNLSRDPDNAYFAEGIQDQVLTQLAKIGALKVISRTSTQQYATKPGSVAEIARQLGVANILEGSVQKAGDAVRINVQLIRADGDSHLWAETYDRKLDNIFGVESEVAQAIAQALNARLTGAEKQELAVQPTANAQAWDAYLHGRVLFERGELLTDENEAIRSLETAVRLDPDFALAWALLSEVHASQNIEFHDTSAAGHQAAREALLQALRLRPDAPETQLAQAYYDFWVERDYDGARRLFEQARRKAPNNAEIHTALALIARRQGRWDDSLASFDQAITLDPRNLETLTQAVATAAGVRNFPLAFKYLDRVRDAAPNDHTTLLFQARTYQAQGRLDQAEPLLAKLAADMGLTVVSSMSTQRLLQRRYADGAVLMRQYIGKLEAAQSVERSLYSFYLAEFQRLAGDMAGANASYHSSLDAGAAALHEQPGNGDLLNLLALIQARLGDQAAARAYHQQALQGIPSGGDALLAASAQNTLARIEAQFGNKDAAIAALQRMRTLSDVATVTKPLINPVTLGLDPEWDALRGDPRFQSLGADTAPATKEPGTP
jgi:TolB-like protein/Tfp pilus assembly protein PilF